MGTTMNDNEELAPEEKVEREVMESVPDDLGYGWFKWNFVVYPGLFAFTFLLVIAQDLYKSADLILTAMVIPFAMIYAVMTGKWIEDNALVIENDDDEFDDIQSVQTSTNKIEDTSIDRIDTFKDDKQTKDEEDEDDGFVEIDIE